MSAFGPHSIRARQALARLPEVDPAITTLALWCTHRDGQGRTRTEGDMILYGAEFPLLPISEQVGVLAHHVLHVALRHSARRAVLRQRVGAAFQADLYDLACDGLVNETLLRSGLALPRPAVRASDLVARLPFENRPRDVLAEWDSDRLYFAISSGSSSTTAASIREYAESNGFVPDLGDADPEGAEPDLWAVRLEQGLAVGRSAGAGIGATLSRFADLPRAGIPWEIRLRRLIQKALSQQPRVSHRRPSKAWLARDAWARRSGTPQPVFEPGFARTERRPRLVVCIDTSSSITETELRLFAAEALSLVRRAGGQADLLGFDTDVHHRARLDRAEVLAALEMRRGGGTDFGPVLAEAERLKPSLIVMFTDLEADYWPIPESDVVWVVPGPHSRKPGFGDVVLLDSHAAGP